MERLSVGICVPVEALRAGLAISRGKGCHERRFGAEFELIFVREGQLSMQEESHCFEVKSGEALLLWPEREHWGTADYPSNLSFYWLHFTIVDVNSSPTMTQLCVAQYGKVKRPDRMAELFQMYLNDQSSGEGDQVYANMLCGLILAETQWTDLSKSRPTAALANKAERFICTHFHERISPSSIADNLDCNPDYLSRLFKATYGQTLTEAIHRARVEYASRYLERTNRPISAVARDCGVSDFSYFVQLFKRYTGLTPTDYRKLHSGGHVNTE